MTNQTILAIGAHPDDIEIDCAGTIAKEIEQGKRVVFYILTNGDKGSDPEVRKKEALKSAEILGVNEVLFEDLFDTYLRYESSLVSRVISTIRKVNPIRIYTHCIRDISPDHSEIGRSTKLAGKNVKEILAYRGSPDSLEFRPNFFVDIEPYMELKEKVLRVFESQNSQDQFGLDYVKSNAIYYGRMTRCGVKYAEAFEVVKIVR